MNRRNNYEKEIRIISISDDGALLCGGCNKNVDTGIQGEYTFEYLSISDEIYYYTCPSEGIVFPGGNGDFDLTIPCDSSRMFKITDETLVAESDGETNSVYYKVNDEGDILIGLSDFESYASKREDVRFYVNLGTYKIEGDKFLFIRHFTDEITATYYFKKK